MLKNLILACLAIFAPIKAAIIVCAALILVDLILGVLAARKRGELITSAGFRRTVTKLFVYEMAILLSFLAETYLAPMFALTKIACALIGLTELTSCVENLNVISGANLLGVLLNKLKSINDKNNNS